MSEMKISDLGYVGSELFQDSESFLNHLTKEEMEIIVGGLGVLEVAAPADAVIERSYVNSANTAGQTYNARGFNNFNSVV